MGRINLLPDSFKIKPSTVKTSELLKKIYIVLFVLIFISVATSIGLFYMYNSKIKDAETRKQSVITQIKALEETEQRLILVKDRLEKVEQISKASSAEKELKGFDFLVNDIDLYVVIERVVAENNSLTLNIKSNSTVETFDFLDSVEDSGEFSSIAIKSMRFNSGTGFETDMSLKKK